MLRFILDDGAAAGGGEGEGGGMDSQWGQGFLGTNCTFCGQPCQLDRFWSYGNAVLSSWANKGWLSYLSLCGSSVKVVGVKDDASLLVQNELQAAYRITNACFAPSQQSLHGWDGLWITVRYDKLSRLNASGVEKMLISCV
jgi:hypothetical protein